LAGSGKLSRWDSLALVRSKPQIPLGILSVLSLRLREFEEQVWR
jgi:hypothetical protein